MLFWGRKILLVPQLLPVVAVCGLSMDTIQNQEWDKKEKEKKNKEKDEKKRKNEKEEKRNEK